MLKEIQPVDLFDIAVQSYPLKVARKDWRRLAGSIYGAMRRGNSAPDIWRELSEELHDALRGGSEEEKKGAEMLVPYIAKLVVGVNNLLVPVGGKITMEQLIQTSASPS